MTATHSPSKTSLALEFMTSLVLDEQDIARSLLENRAADIEALCPDLARWRLAGYVYQQIEQAGLAGSAPPAALQILAHNFELNVDRGKRCTKLLNSISRQLSEASVPFLAFKGAYLAQRFFGDISNRYMWDVDILVHQAQVQKAIKALAGAGLQPSPGFSFDADNRLWGIHALEVRGEAGKVDVHHVIRSLPGMQFDEEAYWRHAREFDLKGVSYLSLDENDTLLAATLGLGADLQNSHHRLRKIWDVYIMLRALDKVTDWGSFFSDRKKEGSLKLVVNMFSFCLNLIGRVENMEKLNDAMALHSELLLITKKNQAEAVFFRPKQHLANRILFSRMLPVSPVSYFASWLISLPARSWHFR